MFTAYTGSRGLFGRPVAYSGIPRTAGVTAYGLTDFFFSRKNDRKTHTFYFTWERKTLSLILKYKA